ncbi:hypothetical protein G112A_00465 [Candidatus Nanosynsacchari sp. TM7_G1_3_12Alb]|nr:hypothetical protein G112A_00465 [Candidatus Nanosynsacchari sp. TM7_G1_3_12Alb]
MEEINLYDLLRFYIKKWLTIAIFVMIGGIVGIAYTYYIQTPQYESKATLLLVGTDHTSGNQESVALNNYVELFKSRRVLDTVIADQGYDKDYDTLVSNVTARGTKSTQQTQATTASADYSATANPGDSYTFHARAAIAKYLQANKQALSPEQRVAAESYTVSAAGAPSLEVGQTVVINAKTIADAVARASSLSASEQTAWSQWATP